MEVEIVLQSKTKRIQFLQFRVENVICECTTKTIERKSKLKSIKSNEMLVSNVYRLHFSGNHKTFIARDHKNMAKGN